MSLADQVYSALQPYFVEIAVAIGLAIFNRQVRKSVRYAYNYLSDKPIKVSLHYAQKYNETPKSLLTPQIYEVIAGTITTDSVKKISTSPHAIRMYSGTLGMPVTLSIDEEYDTATVGSVEQATVLGYFLNIIAEAEITGLRRVDATQDFVNLATKSAQAASSHCFNSPPTQSYLVCDLKDFLRKPVGGRIEDSKLGVTLTLHDRIMTITAQEPNNLSRAIRKYVWKFT